MTNDFLNSSPSQTLLDIGEYSSPSQESKGNQRSDKKETNKRTHSGRQDASKADLRDTEQAQEQEDSTSLKTYFNQPSNLTGWTPIISKTFYQDLMNPDNSTPNKFYLGMTSNSNDIDYAQSVNLTPFINTGFSINSSSAHFNNSGFVNLTPFNEKSLHFADFFMDTPIQKTPMKNLETITPSKFNIASAKGKSIKTPFQEGQTSNKRTTSQVDSPNRLRHNLSICSNAIDEKTEKRIDGDSYPDGNKKVKKNPGRKELKKETAFQTPSKGVLKDVTNVLNKKNILAAKGQYDEKNSKLKTPEGRSLLDSSPSTVIMSTDSKLDSSRQTQRHLRPEELKSNFLLPPSPTPSKEFHKKTEEEAVITEPVMGMFSEKKKTDKLKLQKTKNNAQSGYGSFDSKMGNKTQMQAGMNKFQIVFTDMHSLMNNKNRSRKAHKGSFNPKSKSVRMDDSQKFEHTSDYSRRQKQSSMTFPQEPQSSSLGSLAGNSSQENCAVNNSSKEISITSGSNNSMNTSQMNMSLTGHTSFDFSGMVSTPNNKSFSDKVFDKVSPTTQSINSVANPLLLSSKQPMPPPKPPQIQVSLLAIGLQKYQQPPMMTMSTPQHQSVTNFMHNPYSATMHMSPMSHFTPSQAYYHLLPSVQKMGNSPQSWNFYPTDREE